MTTATESFFQAAGTPLAVLDPGGTFVALNEAWKSVLKNADAVKGKRFEDLLRPSDRENARAIVGRIRGGASETFDGRLSSTMTGSFERLVRFHLAADEKTGDICVTAIASAGRGEDRNRLALFDDILNAPPITAFSLDKSGNFLSWEGAGAEALGGARGNLIGTNALQRWRGSELESLIHRGLAGEHLISATTLPGPIHLQVHLLPTKDAKGEIDGLSGFIANLTPEREAEAQLREKLALIQQQNINLTLLRRVLETASVILWSIDAKGVCTTSEGRGLERLGFKPGQMVGMDLFELYKPVPSILDSLRRALSGEEVRTTVEVGPGIWFDGLSLPLRNSPNGPVEGVIGFAMDVSDRLNTEKALREQLAIVERQNVTMTIFQRVLETTAVVLWCMDTAGTCTISEGKGLDLIGLKPGEMVGSNVLDAYKDNEEIAMSLVRALGGEEVRMISSPVPGLYFDSWSVPLRHEGNGEIQGVVGFAIDATDRIRTEMEVREKLALIERQSATIRALATPIIQVWDEVLCLPVIGTVDSARTADMMQGLLESIVREQARFAIVDLTGVEVVDTSTADHLIQLFRAAKVLGVDGVLCGIRPAVAQTVVALGLDLASVRTMRSLRDALKWCIRARMQPDSTRPKEKETALPSRRLNGQRV